MWRPVCVRALYDRPVQELDLIAAQLPEGVRLDSGDDVLCGRGEWLFERDGGRHVLAQMRGDVILSPKAAQRWAYLLEARTAWLATRGITYVFAVAPAKHVVLPDQLPAGVAVVSRRPVVQIVFWLDKNESPVEVRLHGAGAIRAGGLEAHAGKGLRSAHDVGDAAHRQLRMN